MNIDKLIVRAKSLCGGRLRVLFPDGRKAMVKPAEAVSLCQEAGRVLRVEGDIREQGLLVDLLNGLCGGLDDGQNH